MAGSAFPDGPDALGEVSENGRREPTIPAVAGAQPGRPGARNPVVAGPATRSLRARNPGRRGIG
ncbi:hypothetical protein Acy02nite_05860 [Actinoplanes cyaneus]|uniref:Uncharacterized protein n=1 Tax=Actinoplanes cyaneus TaxID=52696 RepID=A0A919LY76_9ACTN|nr:hypothetical protein Acy02nite_05860 [Actinoplanes cyaneus]